MSYKNFLSFSITDGICTGTLCRYDSDENIMELKDICRFSNSEISVGGHKYHDILSIFSHIKKGISKALKETDNNIESIGISAYGREYGLIDKYGFLIQNVFSCKDSRADNMTDKVLRFIKKDDVFTTTGANLSKYSSMVQLMAEMDSRPYILENTDTFLMLPDLLNYMLTGRKTAEYTNAFSSQLMNCEKMDWSGKIISMLRIRRNIFPEISDNCFNDMLPEICSELKCEPVKIKICGSEISNISAILEKYPQSVIINNSENTKICISADKPVLSKSASDYEIENTGTYNKKFIAFHNENGINITDDTIKCFTQRDIPCSYSKLSNTALNAEPLRCFIDTQLDIFENNDNIPIAIQDYCKNSSQYVPQNVSEMVRCLYESIAFRYADTIEKLKRISSKSYNSVCITGKDSDNPVICRTLADICGVSVYALPEKTGLYCNLAIQMEQSLDMDIRDIISVLIPEEKITEYKPSGDNKALNAYQSFSVTSSYTCV